MNRLTCSLTLLAGLALSVSGLAQDQGFPYLNSLGRLAGVGYTKGGYHAPANGQLPIVKRHHPAGTYSSWRLSYPYNPAYQAFRVSNTRSQVLYQPGMPGPAPTRAPAPPESVEPEVAKPQEPPPPWLKKYLDGERLEEAQESGLPTPAPTQLDQVEEEEELPLPKRRLDSPANSERVSPFPTDEDLLEASPSDRPPQDNDNLLEEDDLLLLDDDLSFRKPVLRPSRQPVRAVVNRSNVIFSPGMSR